MNLYYLLGLALVGILLFIVGLISIRYETSVNKNDSVNFWLLLTVAILGIISVLVAGTHLAR